MKSLASFVKILTPFGVIGMILWIFFSVSTGKLYSEYENLWDYRRLHPDFLPDKKSVQITSMGHENTYADITWIKLVQFIGDNIGNGKYLDFTHTILTHITQIHPYFTRAYELDLLMAPLIYPDSDETTIKKQEQSVRAILSHGEEGVEKLCNQEKLRKIKDTEPGNSLWNDNNLKNPCASGMIPYYLGYHYSNVFHDGEKAEYYYKIASVQDDAPKVSRFLSILAKSEENLLDAGLSFLLVTMEGYDTEPYSCQETAANIFQKASKKRGNIDKGFIGEVEKLEAQLKDTKDSKHPESYASNNCFDNAERGIKQLYLHYLIQIAEKYPDTTNMQELVKKGVLDHIPTIQSQKGFTVKKVNDRWKYWTDTPI